MYVYRYDECLEEVEKLCKPIKEKLAKCLELENNYNETAESLLDVGTNLTDDLGITGKETLTNEKYKRGRKTTRTDTSRIS